MRSQHNCLNWALAGGVSWIAFLLKLLDIGYLVLSKLH